MNPQDPFALCRGSLILRGCVFLLHFRMICTHYVQTEPGTQQKGCTEQIAQHIPSRYGRIPFAQRLDFQPIVSCLVGQNQRLADFFFRQCLPGIGFNPCNQLFKLSGQICRTIRRLLKGNIQNKGVCSVMLFPVVYRADAAVTDVRRDGSRLRAAESAGLQQSQCCFMIRANGRTAPGSFTVCNIFV
ncbi:hypothetical protein IMSAG013_00587 [Clostridiales bacterium]|nr:hypothetical protein IMSAG013_00587 [Clostridiales bacterium]